MGSTPIRGTNINNIMDKIDFSKLKIITEENSVDCSKCALHEIKKRVRFTHDGHYKTNKKHKCNLPPGSKCPLADNQYYIIKQNG